MGYTIKQAAKKAGLTIHTLRYYDKEGLLPFIKRDNSGNRFFTENDMEWLEVICCLKNTGMSIKQIKKYVQWCFVGDETLEARRQMLIEHRKEVMKQINELKQNLKKIDYKITHYNTSCRVEVEDKKIN
ncbi:HTH-type transcriptional regulator AdhR [Oxobacter pfennigii]|uniref:HTH-type transcriptional regulator AdhR n=1 Tax=Oxobacter pfennigii TaxID=36849 RepID=A0A0P8YEI2_9CLOT|nr:MerR family transcriptional regulator [Oxobacter pfennigii]KPU45620.1 HTH-type transcriptional regulator AdhR [Oxobacter pfennigii]